MSKKINKNCFLCEQKKPLTDMKFIKADNETDLPACFICNDCLSDRESTDITNANISDENLNAGKTELICEASIIDHIESSDGLEKALAEFGLDKQEDLMYVQFKLVHANTNKNKDKFMKDELKASEKTPILKMLNWEHGEPNIGVIYDSKYVESSDASEQDYLVCMAAISKYKYKSYAMEMMDRFNEGNLKFSMETFFKGAECSNCNQYFSGAEETYCNHLKDRFSAGNSTARILRGLTFAGCGVVANPADIMAESLALAKEDNKNNESEDKTLIMADKKTYTEEELQAKIDEAVAANSETIASKIAEFEARITTLEGEKTSIAEEKVTLENTIKSLTDELSSVKNEFASEKRAHSWLAELKSIGYELPEASDEKYSDLFNKLKAMDETSFATLKSIMESQIAKTNSYKDKTEDKMGSKDKSKKTAASDDKSNSNDDGDGNLPITASDHDFKSKLESAISLAL